MEPWQARSGWQIAEVQQLTGLPRRDIQRACYEGEGGTGLVHPQESSWGKRSYDANDLAQLFSLKQLRDEGLSLPEASRVLQAALADEASWERYEADQQARLHERAQDAQRRLANAETLHATTSADGDTVRLDTCIYTALLQAIVDEAHDAIAKGTDSMWAHVHEMLIWLSDGGARALAALWEALAACRQNGLTPHDAQTQQTLEGALRDMTSDSMTRAGDISAMSDEGGVPGRALLATLLETADVELALELRLGHGGFAYALDALAMPGQTDSAI